MICLAETNLPQCRLGSGSRRLNLDQLQTFLPLGMPNTADRLVDGTIAAVLMKTVAASLHPSQVVMNAFKELQHAVNAIQSILDGTLPAAALLVDLSKGLQRVNPYWILHILQIRQAPAWVCNYARYVLFGRKIRHKVQGRLLPPRAVHVGVDMGRSFLVFLFCVAMDPIYHYLNRIPSTLSVQGYIDDTTIAGPLHDLSWCHEVYSCYASCRTAGFQLDAHACWQAFSDSCSPFLPCPIEPQSPLLDGRKLHDLPGFAAVSQALQHAIIPKKTVVITHARLWLGITAGEAEGENFCPVTMLLAHSCDCWCKTLLVLNTPASAWALKQLDDSTVGPTVLKGKLQFWVWFC